MSRKALLLLAALALASPLFSLTPASFLPAKTAAKATKLLSAIDSNQSAIRAGWRAARESQLAAEGRAVSAYALLASSRASGADWAAPDGSMGSAEAAAAYAEARAKARTAALALAVAPAKLSGELEAAAGSLAATILASGIKEKAALGLERYIADKAADLAALFPEALEIEALLRKAGAAGALECAAALARLDAAKVAASLLAAKDKIIALSPPSEEPLARLGAALAAYSAWIAAFPAAAYPGELGSASESERVLLSGGAAALSSLGPARAAALLAAMSRLGGRDEAAAEAARRLAEVWAASPAAKRRQLASLCGLGESAMSVFADAAGQARGAASRSASPATDVIAAAAALNGLQIAIADEESLGKAAERGTEPALLLLERPELEALARLEQRYAGLLEEARRRIDALYAQASEGAQGRLEANSEVFKAASLALGSSPTGLIVRSADLPLRPGESGRRISFCATATSASGREVSLPLRAAISGAEYAAAFSRAAGLGSAKTGPMATLSKYCQLTVAAYDPEGSGEAFVLELFPGPAGGSRRREGLGAIDLELALLGGWRP